MDNQRVTNWYYDSDSSSSDDLEQKKRLHCDWASEVEPDGSLFYVKTFSDRKDSTGGSNSTGSYLSTGQPEKNVSGIIKRLIRRNNSSVGSKIRPSDRESPLDQEDPSEDLYLITITKDSKRYQSESGLGILTKNEGDKVIITGVTNVPGVQFNNSLETGDWLYVVNGVRLSPDNVNSVLSGASSKSEISLGIKRMRTQSSGSCAFERDPPDLNKMGIIFLTFDGRGEESSVGQEITYSMPKTNNLLMTTQGAFLTLFHLLPDINSGLLQSTSILFDDEVLNVTYSEENGNIMLLVLPDSRHSATECRGIHKNLERFFKFKHQTLFRCFESKNHTKLDRFFDDFFEQIINGSKVTREFESVLPLPHLMPVPRNIYLQIDDALNELESNNVAAEDSPRQYLVIGSCYAYKGDIVCSHFNREDTLDISLMLRFSGLLRKDGVREIIYWHEVFPLSMFRGQSRSDSGYAVPNGRWFLLATGTSNSLVVALLESGLCTSRCDDHPKPDIAYVGEVQATLNHIIKLGLPLLIAKHFARSWEADMATETKQSQLRIPTVASCQSLSSFPDHYGSLKVFKSSKSLTSLTSQRKFSYENMKPIDRLASESEKLSFDDNGPVLGRRAERELLNEINNFQSGVSVSDISDDSDWHKEGKSDRMSDFSDQFRNTLREDSIDRTFNTLLHYVNLDRTSGVFIASHDHFAYKYTELLNNFREHSHRIQKIFMNPINFKNQKTDEPAGTVNKSLVGVKEFGILFHCQNNDKRTEVNSFWVTGRLIFAPKLQELYVCHRDDCPQNLIEVAFRIASAATM